MNYIIEGNLNLYKEIDNYIIENETDICLLTHLPLENNFITLNCNHKFNYQALYYETCNQKKRNYYDTAPSKYYEIKCPYCRETTPKLLPYFCKYNVEKIPGVTVPSKYCMKFHCCEYKDKSSKKSGNICGESAFISDNGVLCNKHYRKLIGLKIKNNKTESNHQCSKDEIYYGNMLVRELKDILRANKCKVSGVKKDLVARICSEKVIIGNDWIEII